MCFLWFPSVYYDSSHSEHRMYQGFGEFWIPLSEVEKFLVAVFALLHTMTSCLTLIQNVQGMIKNAHRFTETPETIPASVTNIEALWLSVQGQAGCYIFCLFISSNSAGQRVCANGINILVVSGERLVALLMLVYFPCIRIKT